MEFLKNLVKKYTSTSLILRIVIGLVIGAILGVTLKSWTWVGIMGSLFVGALRAVAPILVFVLIISALSSGQSKLDRKFGLVLFFYMISTFLAAAAAVAASFMFPVTMKLGEAAQSDTVPQNVWEVLQNLLMKMVENPVSAIAISAFCSGRQSWESALPRSAHLKPGECSRMPPKLSPWQSAESSTWRLSESAALSTARSPSTDLPSSRITASFWWSW